VASTAAIMRSSVPVTVIRSNWTDGAVEAFRGAGLDVAVSLIDACAEPFQPENVQVDGPVPMAQPPGRETRARPQRATSGPSTRLEARMVLTNSYGASGQTICGVWSRTASPCASTVDPISTSSRSMVRISRTRGMRSERSARPVSSAAASAGKAEFFEPLAAGIRRPWRTVPR